MKPNGIPFRRSIVTAPIIAAIGVAAACVQPATAQAFPSKPIRIVVPFPAGGSFDVMSRLLAQRVQLDQTTREKRDLHA